MKQILEGVSAILKILLFVCGFMLIYMHFYRKTLSWRKGYTEHSPNIEDSIKILKRYGKEKLASSEYTYVKSNT